MFRLGERRSARGLERDDGLDRTHDLVGTPTGEHVGAQAAGVSGIGDGGPAEQDGHVRGGLAQRGDRPAGRLGRACAVHAIPTATRSGSPATVSASASAGVSAPSSTTSNPRHRSRLAVMATGNTCRSPGAAARTTVPRLCPRRAKRAPSLLMSRAATLLARCSSATESLPCSQSVPMECSAGATSSRSTSSGSMPDASASSRTSHAPASSLATSRASRRARDGALPAVRVPCRERSTCARSAGSTCHAPRTRLAGSRPVRT